MIVESPLILLEFVYTSVPDHGRFLRVKFLFLKNFLDIAFSIFCFGISALEFFYLSTLCKCYLIVLAESGGGRIILLLCYLIFIQKIQKYLLLCIVMHCTLHFAWYLH